MRKKIAIPKKVKNQIDKYSSSLSLRSLESASLALIIIDSEVGLTFEDKRILKESIENTVTPIVVLNKWDLLETNHKDDTTTFHGFIAQEVKTAIDADSSIKDGFKLWDDREDGSQEVAEAALIPVLVKAIQELSAKNEALLTRIEALEG